MSKFWDKVDEKTKAKSEDFIKRLKSNKIVKRVLPNVYMDFPVDEAFESFKALVDSEEQRKLEDSYYAGD